MKQSTFLTWLFFIGLLSALTSHAQTTTINGITVIVDYYNTHLNQFDYQLNATETEVSAMMNQTNGFTNWGNNGSVKEYFYNQSNGKVILNSHVIRVTLNQTFNYYHGSNLGYDGGQRLLVDVVAAIENTYPNGFNNLTMHPTENRLWHFSILTSGYKGIGVAYGYDGSGGALYVKNNGSLSMPIGNVGLCGYTYPNKPEINVICHELGHSIFGWTDYYNNRTGSGTNIGHYCMMGSGGMHGSAMPISPALRYQKGWIDNVITIANNSTQTYTVASNNYNQVYKYNNPFNAKEYLLIESYIHDRYYLSVDGDGHPLDQGLAVWHVHEDGLIDQPDSPQQPYIKLIQADALDEMHDRDVSHQKQRGDLNDLFDNTYNSLSDASHPFLRWKDGSETGLILTEISGVGSNMTFKVNARANTISVAPAVNGKTVPAGTINVTGGQNKTLTFVPDFFYEVDQINVNGISQGAINNYTFNNVSGNHNVTTSFKESTSGYGLPSPWQSTDIGFPGTAGKGGYKDGKFGIRSYGNDIWGNYDQFHYVYRSLQGNGEIIVHIADMNQASPWSKSGIMIRESLDPGSKHVMLVKTPWNGVANQYRSSTGGGSDNFNRDTISRETWFKLVRSGNTFTSSYSQNGTSWTVFHSVNVSMQSNVYIGMCASGINSNLPNKTVFDQVSVNGSSVNQAPSVSITTPVNNANFTAPASISIAANATDIDGTISKVEFYQGATLLYTDTSSPYAYTWTGVSAGNYSITARAFDNHNASTNSSVINISVTGGGGECTNPQYVAGTTYATGVTVKNNGRKYECTVGGWCSSSAAWAYEPGVGTAWTSAWIDVGECSGGTSNQAPTISLTAPTNNNSYTAPASITITANATDADGTISKVEFYQGSTLLNADTSSPYSYSWTGVGAGTYTITAIAFDNNNASTTSAGVNITVNNPSNQLPTVSITAPSNNANYSAPASVNISATASDADGTITKVEFYQGTTLLATDTSSPYAYNWTGVIAGSYVITAKAFDNSNASATSATVTIIVTGGGTCTAPAWNSGTAYTTNNEVAYNGIRYKANWWTMNERPDLNNGPTGSGKPWTSLGTCNSRMGELDAFVAKQLVSIAPNPMSNSSVVEINVSEDDAFVSLQVIDQFGRKVLDVYQGMLKAGSHSFELDGNNLSQGLYTLSFKSQHNLVNTTFIKQ